MAFLFLGRRKRRNGSSLSGWSATDLCPRLDDPGVGKKPSFIDFSELPTTPDQRRIETVLARLDLATLRLLHVGIGDSGLAARFHDRCRGIDGLSIAERELRQARTLGLARYRVFQLNKYSRQFVQQLEPGYGLVVDNNLASYACCAYHYAQMFDNYRWALAPGGRILTEQQGMDWVAGDKHWRMTYDDLTTVGRRFGLEAERLTDSVYSLRRVR